MVGAAHGVGTSCARRYLSLARMRYIRRRPGAYTARRCPGALSISTTHNRAVAALGLAIALVVSGLARPESLDPPSTGGMVALHRLLSRLDAHRRVLVIGAHPDDEDTALLALVARGMGGEAAYLSLSRGEGGQNLIGPELGEELGLIRTQELLAARGVDGARQFFTRAFDFGYTRSLDETLEKWPKEAILEDTVRVVRRFKPQVIVSIFPTTAEAGHGQHQEAGVAAHEVFAASADTARFPAEEGLPPWRASALYRSTFFRPTPDSLTLATGTIDPASGKTYFQLAMASRSMHRSQDMGVLQDIGPRATRVGVGRRRAPDGPAGEAAAEGRLLVAAPAAIRSSRLGPERSGDGAAGDLFAGVDTRLRAIADALAPGPSATRWRLRSIRLGRGDGVARRARRRAASTRRRFRACARSSRCSKPRRSMAGGAGRPRTSGRWRAISSPRSSSSRAKRWRSRPVGCSTPTPSRPLWFQVRA